MVEDGAAVVGNAGHGVAAAGDADGDAAVVDADSEGRDAAAAGDPGSDTAAAAAAGGSSGSPGCGDSSLECRTSRIVARMEERVVVALLENSDCQY